jgi:quercetin dioxygenase-like cupin family protein
MRTWGALLALVGAGALLIAVAGATPATGVVSNVILAQGTPTAPLREKIRVGDNWGVTLEDHGQSEFYVQDLVVGPGGRTGWHSHPGLLLITIKEGSITWYGKDCEKRSYSAGESFTEAADPHNVLNPGSGNAQLFIAYIVKKGEPRRIEASQPKCAEALGIQ